MQRIGFTKKISPPGKGRDSSRQAIASGHTVFGKMTGSGAAGEAIDGQPDSASDLDNRAACVKRGGGKAEIRIHSAIPEGRSRLLQGNRLGVPLRAEMPQHHGVRSSCALPADPAQERGGIRVAHVEPAVGIEMLCKQIQVVIGLDEDEIRVREMIQGRCSVVKIGHDHRLLPPTILLVAHGETMIGVVRMVRNLEGLEPQVADGERRVGEGLQSEGLETPVAVEMPFPQLIQAPFVDPDAQAVFLDRPQGVAVDVIPVHVGDDHRVDGGRILEVPFEEFPRPTNGARTAVDDDPGMVAP